MRGCGTRREGVYIVCDVSENGRPLEWFMVDPPLPLNPTFTLPKRGVHFVEDESGDMHLLDWVGVESYPYPSDFLEETRVKGASRRVSPKLDFSKLNNKSKIVFVHQKAHILNAAEYPSGQHCNCLKVSMLGTPGGIGLISDQGEIHLAGHNEISPMDNYGMCLSCLYEDIEPFDNPFDKHACKAGIEIARKIGDVIYSCKTRDPDITPVYSPATFLGLPVSRIEVVGPQDGPQPWHNELLATIRRQTWLEVVFAPEV